MDWAAGDSVDLDDSSSVCCSCWDDAADELLDSFLSLLVLLLSVVVLPLLRLVPRFFFLDFVSFPFALLDDDDDAASFSVDDPPRGIRNDKSSAACLLVLEGIVLLCLLSRHVCAGVIEGWVEETPAATVQQGDAVAAVQVVATASMLTAAAAAFFVHLLSIALALAGEATGS